MMVGASANAMRTTSTLQLALIGTAIALLTWTGPFIHHRFGSFAFGPLTIACAAGAGWAFLTASRSSAPGALWIVLGIAAAIRLGMLLVEPYFSTDIYRYIWDGRMQAAGINPYRYVPAAPELAQYRDTVIFPKINRADYAVTIYPPAAQMIFWLITRLGESVLVMKSGLLVFEAATIAAIIGILRLLGRPAAGVVAYAWHPLPIWEIAVNGHIDTAMLAFLMLGLWVALMGAGLAGAVLITIGALVKPFTLLALPVIWRPWDWRLPLAVVTTTFLFYLPYLDVGWDVLGFLPGYAQEEGISDGRGFWLLARLQEVTGPLPAAKWLYLAASAGLLGTLALRAAFRAHRTPETTIISLTWMSLAFLVLLAPDYPWYFLLLMPFLALSPLLSPWVLTSGAMIIYHVIDNDRVLHFDTSQNILYGATLLAVAYDLWPGRRATAARFAKEARR